MKYYVTSDCMCSINVAFNIKTGENFFFLEFFRLKNLLSLLSLFLSTFFTMRNCTRDTHKDRLRGSDGNEA